MDMFLKQNPGKRPVWWLLPGLLLLGVACAVGTPDGSSMVYVDAAADVFVYDASIGPEQPIAGAASSVCGEFTNERGLVTCMWYGGQMTVSERDRLAQAEQTITVTITAQGYGPLERSMTYRGTPTLAIGLWPEDPLHLPDAAPPAESLVVNGDFGDGLAGWEVVSSTSCEGCRLDVQTEGPGNSPVLHWERSTESYLGAAIWARQPLYRDVSQCQHLALGLDVQVQRQSLYASDVGREGSTGEYPARVRLVFTGETGGRFEWVHGFVHARRDWDELVNYTLIPEGVWTSLAMDVLASGNWVDPNGGPLPRPATLEALYVGGNGREFAAAMGNLHLGGCDAPLAPRPTPISPPMSTSSPPPVIPIPADQLLFLEMSASADSKATTGEPLHVDLDAPVSYTWEDGVLRSEEPIPWRTRLLLGESVALAGDAGSGVNRRLHASSSLPGERSIGGTHVPLRLTARVVAVEADGTAHLVLNGESVTLRPGTRWMRQEVQVVETERATIEYTSQIAFRNHGLLPKENVVGLLSEPTPTHTPSATPTPASEATRVSEATPTATPTRKEELTETPISITLSTATPTQILGPTATEQGSPAPPPPGTIAFEQDWTIWLVNTDGSELRGLTSPDWHCAAPAWSPDGSTLTVVCDPEDGDQLQLWTVDRGGGEPHLLAGVPAFHPAWSPNGGRIAFESGFQAGDRAEINMWDLESNAITNLTHRWGYDGHPVWSPDGTYIAYSSQRQARDHQIWMMDADGGDPHPVTTGPAAKQNPAWSPDRRYLLYTTTGEASVYRIDLESGERILLRQNAAFGSWSPDGAWIAYKEQSPEGLWLMRADGSDAQRVLDGDVYRPAWAPR